MTVHKLFSENLEKAIKVRKEFLDNLPPDKKEKMLQFQKEIEEKLNKAGNQHNRMIICRQLMMEKLAEFNRQLLEIRNKI